MRLMLDNPDLRAIPRNLRRLGGQTGNEAKQVQRYLLGDVRRYQLGGDAGLPTRVRQPPISDSGRAASRAVTGRCAEPGVPEQVIPMRMRRKPCHNGLAQLAKVVREGGHFVAVHPGVDEQHASPAVHDNGVALAELALVDQHTLRDLPQHGCKATRAQRPPTTIRATRVATELGQLLQLLDDWLATGHEQIGTSLARFIGIDGYGVETLRDDLARFMFLLGETDGEGLFSPRTVELIEPAALPALTPANPVSSARGTFSPAELAEIEPLTNVSPAANEREYERRAASMTSS
jgi:hypothetical protein